MTNEKEIITLYRAVQLYSPGNQLIKLVEECSELAQAVCKFMELKTGDRTSVEAVSHMCEEIADVEIMLGQFRLIFPDASDKIREWKRAKLERLESRIEYESEEREQEETP